MVAVYSNWKKGQETVTRKNQAGHEGLALFFLSGYVLWSLDSSYELRFHDLQLLADMTIIEYNCLHLVRGPDERDTPQKYWHPSRSRSLLLKDMDQKASERVKWTYRLTDTKYKSLFTIWPLFRQANLTSFLT